MSSREEYLSSVCREVRFYAARKYVKQELSDHIDDKRAYLEQTGAADAEAEAVNAMGDPIQTGRALNAIHRPRTEWGIIACVLVLTVAGIALSIMSIEAMQIDFSDLFGLNVEWIMLALSLTAMMLLMFANYRWFVRLRYACFGAGLAFIAAYIVFTLFHPNVDFSEVGLPDTGSGLVVRNVILSGIILKKTASAISSTLFFLGTAGFLNIRIGWRKADIALLAGCLFVSVCAVFIVSVQFALLTAIAALVMLLFSLAHSPLRKAQKRGQALIIVCAAAVPLTLCLLFFPQPAVGGRDMLSMFFPGAATDPEFRQFIQPSSMDNAASVAFKSSGWLFSVGGTLVFIVMIVLLLHRSLKLEDTLGRTLALGVCAVFTARCLFYILGILGVTGILSAGIPFISDGVSAYLFNSLLTGVFLSVWQRSSFMRGHETRAQVAFR